MGETRFRVSSTKVFLSLCLGAILLQGIARGKSVRDAVKYGEAIVSLNREGKFLAWDAGSGKSKPDRIASNGKRIWDIHEFRKIILVDEAIK